MKKMMLFAALTTLGVSQLSYADYDYTINGGVGSMQASPCASVGGNANCDVDIDVKGGIDNLTVSNTGNVYIDGKVANIKGKDGKDGTNGTNGKDGAKGDTGLAGINGKNGTNGKDADMSVVNKNTSDISNHEQRLTTVENMTDGLNRVVGTNKQDIEELKDGKADKSAIDKEIVDRTSGDKLLDTKIDKNAANQSVKDKSQDTVISAKVDKSQYSTDKVLQGVHDATQDTVLVGLSTSKADKKDLDTESIARNNADKVVNSRVDATESTLVQHDQRITGNTQRVSTVENRVANLEQSTNHRFSELKNTVDDNRKKASAGVAGAAAMANIPQVSQNATFSVGAGIGSYDSEQSVAVGFSARINNNVVTKMSVANSTQSELLVGAGVGVEW